MELKALITLFVALFAALTGGGDGKKTDKKEQKQMSFVSVTSGGSGEVFVVKNDGDEKTIEINGDVIDGSGLAVGESKEIKTKRGTVTLSRDEDGLQIKNEDGKIVRLFGEDDESGHVMAIGGNHFKVAAPEDTIVILGLDNLDESIRQKVRAALAEAGVDKEVVFAGGPQMLWVDGEEGEIEVNGNAIFIGDEDNKDVTVKHVKVLKIKKQSGDDEDDDEDQ